MTTQEIRQAYFGLQESNGHKIIPRANLVPQDDPTTLFTGSGMQPLIQYLLGEDHPQGVRLADSQMCLRAEDIEEVGDNRHTTFFEMLGNWSLGDYFKAEQLPWFWEFLVGRVGLDPEKLYVTCFSGDEANGIPKDEESATIWQNVFKEQGIEAKVAEIGSEEDGYKRGMKAGERVFYYDASKNWWSRSGEPKNMPVGEPGGPDSEVFYLFKDIEHDESYGENCHPNCDCGRFLEIGNSVFMEYLATDDGFKPLPKKNVDFGGGLERIAAAKLDEPDMFKISLLWPIIEKLEEITKKSYKENTEAMRVIADHLRAATWLAVDGVTPSNKEQGYVARRLVRRAVLKAHELGIESQLCEQVIPIVVDVYKNDFTEMSERGAEAVKTLAKEESIFRQTLRRGLREFEKIVGEKTEVYIDENGNIFEHMPRNTTPLKEGENSPINTSRKMIVMTGKKVFKLYDTYGFPVELSVEAAGAREIKVTSDWKKGFNKEMQIQRQRSRTATKGQFKGGLGGQTDIHKKYHTATHLMYKALKIVLGDHVLQRGSNITEERLRFDFEHPEKMTPEQIAEVEEIVNEQIQNNLHVSFKEVPTDEAMEKGALGAFGDTYGDKVKVYQMENSKGEKFSFEICGGPHVEHTSELAADGKVFKIVKEQSSSAGIRRIKAKLV